MEKFTFSLYRLLELRSEATKKAMEEMAPALAKLNGVVEKLSLTESNLKGVQTMSLDDDLSRSVNRTHTSHLRVLVKGLKEQEKKYIEELVPFREKLLKAKKEERVLELLRDKQKQEWKKKMAKREERVMEEMVLSFRR